MPGLFYQIFNRGANLRRSSLQETFDAFHVEDSFREIQRTYGALLGEPGKSGLRLKGVSRYIFNANIDVPPRQDFDNYWYLHCRPLLINSIFHKIIDLCIQCFNGCIDFSYSC